MSLQRKLLTAAVAVALGLEIICPGGGDDPHIERDVILKPDAVREQTDELRPVVTPPENPFLLGYTLRVTSPDELNGWWVNLQTTTSHGLVTVGRTQICGEARFNESAVLRNMNTPEGIEGHGHKTRVYVNEDYSIGLLNRKMAEQLQLWLAQRGVTTQLLYAEKHFKGKLPDMKTPLSNFAPAKSDADGVTEIPT
jgi:hypothetical protein